MSRQTYWLGGGFVVVSILIQATWLGLPAILLSIGLVLSFLFWTVGRWRCSPALAPAFRIAILVFVCHATEEYLTGFATELPALFGRPPWTDAQFLLFNGGWLAVFLVAAIRIDSAHPLAVLIVLFFAIVGGVANGVVHLMLVVLRGAYFPGAWTAPLCLVAGVWLLRLLYAPGAGLIPRKRGVVP